MKDQILELLDQRRFVTFQELACEVPGFSGDYSFESGEHAHLVLWPRVSVEAGALLQEMLEAGTIHLHGTSLLNYAIEGYLPERHMPQAKHIRSYKSLHWFPATISKELSEFGDCRAKKPGRKG